MQAEIELTGVTNDTLVQLYNHRKHTFKISRKNPRTLTFRCGACGYFVTVARGDIRRLTVKKRTWKSNMYRNRGFGLSESRMRTILGYD